MTEARPNIHVMIINLNYFNSSLKKIFKKRFLKSSHMLFKLKETH